MTSAQNVGEAQSVGLESNVVGAFFNNDLITTWSYTLQQVVDKTGRDGINGTLIPYTPVEMIALTALYDNGTVLARGEWTYTSHRYAQPGGEYSSLMPSYALLEHWWGASRICARCEGKLHPAA